MHGHSVGLYIFLLIHRQPICELSCRIGITGSKATMMNRYDFLNLSYVEFEELCRDLLQRRLAVILESFAEGVDGGIDLRYFRDEEEQMIVQCKRYATYKDLHTAVKKEVPKLGKFENLRYILATSVNLTVGQKAKLAALLAPYLRNESDIIANKDLNAILRVNPEIENRHFKLWIQSTGVIERIFKSKIVNQSHFEMERIRELLKLYVINPSFGEAEKILEKNRFVIISGIPGIGKTTLARVLTYLYLSRKDYSEFVYLSNSIDEGYENYKEGVKQIFLYDDFLGQSFEDRSLDRNEDARIIEFIRQVRKSKDKILLFTTREYILRDVQQKHDLLTDADIEFSKCMIDLSSYTLLIKAKILYNHLFFSGLPAAHLHAFAEPCIYNTIIEHKNYSPRTIETAIRQELMQVTLPTAFTKNILASLDNPYKLWETPFTSQITDMSRWLLTIILTMGSPVFIEDAKEACRQFYELHGNKYFPHFTEAFFLKSLKELEGSFLISQKDDNNKRILEFQNPSIRDFLLHYFDGNKDQLIPVIQSVIFYEQLFHIFTSKKTGNDEDKFSNTAKKISSDAAVNIERIKKITSDCEKLGSCQVTTFKSQNTGNPYWRKYPPGQYTILNRFSAEYERTGYEVETHAYVLIRMKAMIDLPKGRMETQDLIAYISLLKTFAPEMDCQPGRIIQAYSDKLDRLFEYQYYFKNLEEVFPEAYQIFVTENEGFSQKIFDMANDEIRDTEPDQVDSMINTLEDMGNLYYMDFRNELKKLRQPEPEQTEEDNEDDGAFGFIPEQRKEKEEIDSMFSSLKAFD